MNFDISTPLFLRAASLSPAIMCGKSSARSFACCSALDCWPLERHMHAIMAATDAMAMR